MADAMAAGTCPACGGPRILHPSAVFCKECGKRAKKYRRSTWWVCIKGGLYTGGIFYYADFRASLEGGVWPPGSLWEKYHKGEYQGTFRVVGDYAAKQSVQQIEPTGKIVGYGVFLPKERQGYGDK